MAIEILRAADRVKRSAVQVIAPHGLTLSQYNALRILRGAPEGLSTMEVCQRLLERSPGITRIIDGLVKKGLVQRAPHPSDRRSILCTITDAGRKLADALDEPIDRSDRELTRGLAPTEVKQLAELLSRVGKREG
jgi:DNA-binding MarR family transcriptional regulator